MEKTSEGFTQAQQHADQSYDAVINWTSQYLRDFACLGDDHPRSFEGRCVPVAWGKKLDMAKFNWIERFGPIENTELAFKVYQDIANAVDEG